MDIQELMEITYKRGASDLHILVGYNPVIRIDGKLYTLTDQPVVTTDLVGQLVFSLLSAEQKDIFLANRELDFSYSSRSAHFRVNIYYQRGSIALAARLIPAKIRSIDEINLNRDAHIVTIEDPIEYIYPKSRGIVSQREMRLDTHSWEMALRSVL